MIELMIVVVVIGLLAAMAISTCVNMQSHAKEASTKTYAPTVQLAVEDYSIRNDGIYSGNPGAVTPLLPGLTISSGN